jgi:hypothetical protein
LNQGIISYIYKSYFLALRPKVLLLSGAMPRPRKNDPSSLINPLVADFAQRLAAVVERFTVGRIEAAVRASGNSLQGRRGRPVGSTRGRSKTLCYYPGCKNIAAPRFGMFCAALHKNLPKTEKEKYRAQHEKDAGKAASAGKRGRKKKKA